MSDKNNIKTAIKNQNKIPARLWFAGGVLPLLLAPFLNFFFAGSLFIQLSLSTAMGAAGAAVAAMMLLVINGAGSRNILPHKNTLWIGAGLLALIIFDLAHAFSPNEATAKLLQSVGTLIAGIFFALVRISHSPQKTTVRTVQALPLFYTAAILCVFFADSLIESYLPFLYDEWLIDTFSVIGLFGFSASFLYFYERFSSNGNVSDLRWVLVIMTYISGTFLLIFTEIWSAVWWLAQIVHFSAYMSLSLFFYYGLQQNSREILDKNEELSSGNKDLQQSMDLKFMVLQAQQIELEQQKRALETATVMSITDTEERIKYVNERFCRLSGYSDAELYGKTFKMLRSGKHSEAFYETKYETLRRGEVWRSEICRRAKDGQFYWIDSTAIPFIGEDGRPYQFMFLEFDITAKKNSENKLQESYRELLVTEEELRQNSEELQSTNEVLEESKEQLELSLRKEKASYERAEKVLAEWIKLSAFQTSLLKSVGIAIISTDTEGLITSFNAAAESWLGYKAAELKGKAQPVIFHDLKELLRSGKELTGQDVFAHSAFKLLIIKASMGVSEKTERTYISKNGERRPVLETVSPIRNEVSEITGYLFAAQDISEQKQAEEKLREAYDRLRISDREIRQNLAKTEEINEQLAISKEQTEEQKNHLERQTAELLRQQRISQAINRVMFVLQSRQTLQIIYRQLISELARTFGASQAAFHQAKVNENQEVLFYPAAHYALSDDFLKAEPVRKSEGLIGTAAEIGDILFLDGLQEAYMESTSAFGRLRSNHLTVVPFKDGQNVVGVAELGTLRPPTEYQIEFIRSAADRIALSLARITADFRSEDLLNELLVNNKQLSQREEELSRTGEELKAVNENLEEGIRKGVAQISRQKEIIEEKNRHITDSLRYALHIQGILLPAEAELSRFFTEHFVIFVPKDMVSGDFYWLKETEKYLFIAVADCTGHGVPGAFMGMVGNTILNEKIGGNQVEEPAEILRLLNIGVNEAFKQTETDNSDGMDIALCRIDLRDRQNIEVVFAGAKRPLLYVRDGKTEEITGDRFGIGGYSLRHKIKQFNNHRIKLRAGDTIYMCSDGFSDQPNNLRKKFGSVNLKKCLAAHAHESLLEQEAILLEEFQEHRMDTEQRDDITVIGLRF